MITHKDILITVSGIGAVGCSVGAMFHGYSVSYAVLQWSFIAIEFVALLDFIPGADRHVRGDS